MQARGWRSAGCPTLPRFWEGWVVNDQFAHPASVLGTWLVGGGAVSAVKEAVKADGD